MTSKVHGNKIFRTRRIYGKKWENFIQEITYGRKEKMEDKKIEEAVQLLQERKIPFKDRKTNKKQIVLLEVLIAYK